jgi:iron complex outermembrane receptor protein
MPEDIESIDVLRSASATAIYGMRGANGVMLITTKRGENGKPTVSYSTYAYIQDVSSRSRFLSADEWRQVKKDWANSPNQQLRWYADKSIDYGADTDWVKAISQNKISQVHNLSLSGGFHKTTYYVALNYRDHEGMLKKTGKSIFNGRAHLTQKAFKDKLTLEGSYSFSPMQYNQHYSFNSG